MKATVISISQKKSNADAQHMTSLEIAELTGKQHKDVLKAIRNMELGWVQVAGRKFALGSYTDSNNQQRPCYLLTKTETLYVATKFNDEARDLNSFLCDQGIIRRVNGEWELTPKYLHRDLTEKRHTVYYDSKGQRKMRKRLVWTETGREFIKKIIEN